MSRMTAKRSVFVFSQTRDFFNITRA